MLQRRKKLLELYIQKLGIRLNGTASAVQRRFMILIKDALRTFILNLSTNLTQYFIFLSLYFPTF